MSVWVVVGGQYGSEGKGKISAVITQRENIDICIRCGGPNSGHSVLDASGRLTVVRQLPTGFVSPQTVLMIPAGALINLSVLRSELSALGLDSRRVRIDRNAMIIDSSDIESERRHELHERLSSTLCGIGSAVARRALRSKDVRLAKDAAVENSWLSEYLDDVSTRANEAIDSDRKVLIEGTQGFGLSLYHAQEYPKATSRDTTAAACLSEVGVSPRSVSEIVVVLRTFPIRVAGQQAGSLKDEVSWETVRDESGSPFDIQEFTTVTQKLRRVGRFDWDLARRAVMVNRPTRIAINGIDYLDHSDRHARSFGDLSSRSQNFINELQTQLRTPVSYVGIHPCLESTIAMVGSEVEQDLTEVS